MSVYPVTFRLNAAAVKPSINIVSPVPDLAPDFQIGRTLPLISPLFHRPVVDPNNPRGDLRAERGIVVCLHVQFLLV
jgi:hypothetical protein